MATPFLVFAGLEARLERCAETGLRTLKCEGHLDDANSSRFREFLAGVLRDSSQSEVRVDLSRIWSVRPAGLAPLLAALREHPGRIALEAPTRPVTRAWYDRVLAMHPA